MQCMAAASEQTFWGSVGERLCEAGASVQKAYRWART